MIPEFQDPDRRETFVYEYRVMYRVEPAALASCAWCTAGACLSNVPGSFEEAPQEAYSAA